MPTPQCLCHPQQPISSLCLHSTCVLPMCMTCQDKHRREFPQGDHLSKIVRWSEAKSIAINAIKDQRDKMLEMDKQIQDKIEEFRVRVSICVNRCLESIARSVRSRVKSVSESVVELQQSAAWISQGNVKEIISHFDQGAVFKCPKYEVSYQIVEETLGQCLSNFINVKALNVVDVSSHRESVVEGYRELEQESNKNRKSPEGSKLRVQDLKIQCGSSTKKPRTGIFVASSPSRKQRGVYSQSLQSRKLKQTYLDQQNSKPKAPFTPSQNRHHRSIFKSSIQIRQSPFFSEKKQLQLKDLNTPSKPQLDYTSRHLHTKSQKNIKSLTRNKLASQSTSRLILRRREQPPIPNDLLTPQQMRQLITRKQATPAQPQTELAQQSPNYYQRLLTDKLSLDPK